MYHMQRSMNGTHTHTRSVETRMIDFHFDSTLVFVQLLFFINELCKHYNIILDWFFLSQTYIYVHAFQMHYSSTSSIINCETVHWLAFMECDVCWFVICSFCVCVCHAPSSASAMPTSSLSLSSSAKSNTTGPIIVFLLRFLLLLHILHTHRTAHLQHCTAQPNTVQIVK